MTHSAPASSLASPVAAQLRRTATFRPDAPAVIDGDRILTYGALWAAVDRLIPQLAAQGVGPHQGVGVMAPNGAAMIEAVLAASGLGAVVMPISPALAPGEMRSLLTEAAPHGIITIGAASPELTAMAAAPPAPLTGGDDVPMAFHRLPAPPDQSWIPHLPEAAFVRFTSGTTAAARGVVINHAAMLERIDVARRGLGLTAEDRVLWVLPMAFHFFVSILTYLATGSAIVLAPGLLAADMLEAAQRGRATILYASPVHVRLLAGDASSLTMPDLRLAVSVSSGLDPALSATFRERYGLPVTQALGVIEAGLPLVNLADPAGRPGAVGRPTAGCDAAIWDAVGRPLPDGATGELALRGPGMLAGWLQPPRTRDAILRDGWFLTGDLARRDPDGVITILGRLKSAINVAGHKVFPEEVAAALERHPAVAAASLTGRPHPLLGEAVHARLELKPGASTPTLAELRDFARPWLSTPKLPVSMEIVTAVPRTASGKTRHGD